MRFFLLFIMCIFSFSKTFCNEEVYLLTIPKSGTHCIEKYFNLLRYLHKTPPYKIFRSHVSERHLKLPKNYFLNTNVKKIILVRDIRDILISSLHWIENQKHYLHSNVRFLSEWKGLSFEEKMIQLIDYKKKPEYIIWQYKDRYLPQQIKKVIDKAKMISRMPNVLVVKFEDLSGGNGQEAQIATMKKINAYLDVTLNEDEYCFLVENIFGDKLIKSMTFRKGESYAWKKKIKDTRLLEIIWDYYGDFLSEFEYEKD